MDNMQYLHIFLFGLIDLAKNYIGTQKLFDLLGTKEIQGIFNIIPKGYHTPRVILASLIKPSDAIDYQAKCFIVSHLIDPIPEKKPLPADDKDKAIQAFILQADPTIKVPQGTSYLHKTLFSHILHIHHLNNCTGILNVPDVPTNDLERALMIALNYQYAVIQIAKLSLR